MSAKKEFLPKGESIHIRLRMVELKLPDIHYLNAATGWLELGNAVEALAEFERISPEHRNHPDVLETEWVIRSERKEWARGLEITRKLMEISPNNPSSWIHYSFSLHELKQTKAARAQLIPALEKFPDVATIPYNLACYACQLGDYDEARQWLDQAVRIKGKKEIKQMALKDADLAPMREEIEKY
jgi:tetratricopeptide (TPR) repeat protein